jgi:hypothetical protein
VKQSRKPAVPADNPASSSAGIGEIVQVKVWLLGISPMVWRRVLVPESCTLRELHGVLQVAMGWEGIHLYQFSLRARSLRLIGAVGVFADVTLAALRLRKGTRFLYEYDLNIPWRHGVRIEDRLAPQANTTHPVCNGGGGACPPEDCDGPAGFMARRDEALSWNALEDLGTMANIIGQVVLERRPDILDDDETRWRLEQALEHTRARERAQGRVTPCGRIRLTYAKIRILR